MNYDQWKLETPESRYDDDYLDYLSSHHDCCICRDKDVSEEIMYKTSMGWMCIDCYESIVSDPDTTESETPIIL